MKMTKKFENLNSAFNLSGDLVSIDSVETIETKSNVEKIVSTIDDVKKDYDYTRGNLYSLI